MTEILMDRDELMRELEEAARYWPWDISDLRVGYPYPTIAAISKNCTVFVHCPPIVH